MPSDSDRRLVVRGDKIVCIHSLVVPLVQILRGGLIRDATRSDGHKRLDTKNAKWFGYWLTGEGRNRLTSAAEDIERLRTLDDEHVTHTRRNLANRAKVYADQAKKIADILAAWDGVFHGDDDGRPCSDREHRRSPWCGAPSARQF